jgi:PadR family transcriptional regulator, regulatory protein AphA
MKSKSIRLTQTSYALLALLDRFGEMTSYDIKIALESSIENFWPVPHTTAYQEPARLVEGGYLSATQEEGGRRRRLYAMTDTGSTALRKWADDPVAAQPQLRDEMLLKIFAGADPAPLVAERIAWYRRKLAELQGYLDEIEKAGATAVEDWRGPQRTLRIGVAFNRHMIDMIEELEADDA